MKHILLFSRHATTICLAISCKKDSLLMCHISMPFSCDLRERESIEKGKKANANSGCSSSFPYTAGTSKPHHMKLPADIPKSMESPLPPVGIPPSLGGLPLPSHPMSFDARMPILDPLRKVS